MPPKSAAPPGPRRSGRLAAKPTVSYTNTDAATPRRTYRTTAVERAATKARAKAKQAVRNVAERKARKDAPPKKKQLLFYEASTGLGYYQDPDHVNAPWSVLWEDRFPNEKKKKQGKK